MTAWTTRRDPRGGTTFISYSTDWIELLAPPGNHPCPRRWVDVDGDGLWWQGRWPRADDIVVDLDPPASARRVPTVVVLAMLDEPLHDDVVTVLRDQLQDAWALCQPDVGCPVDDRRAARHAGFVMQLHAELSNAFPHADVYDVLRLPQVAPTDPWAALDAIRCDLPATAPAPLDERDVSVRLLVVTLTRTVWARLRGQRTVGTVDVVPRSSHSGACATIPPPVAPPPVCGPPLH